jgi:hypothetical protein
MVFSAIGGVVAPADPMLDPPLPANGMPTLPALQYVFCVFIPTAGGRQRLQSHVVGAQEHHSWRPPRMRYSTLVRPHLPLATACNNHHRTPAHLESLEPREREGEEQLVGPPDEGALSSMARAGVGGSRRSLTTPTLPRPSAELLPAPREE